MIRFLSLIVLLIIKNVQCDDLINSVDKNEESMKQEQNIVRVDMYYETLCPGSISDYINQFAPLVRSINKHLDVHTYPFGGAKITYKDGIPKIKCHHGHRECVGNALHACAIDVLKNTIDYVEFNTCLMEENSAEECGRSLKMNSEAIINCSISNRTMELMEHYGKETKKQHLRYVPYFLINGESLKKNHDLMEVVCDQFNKRPIECDN